MQVCAFNDRQKKYASNLCIYQFWQTHLISLNYQIFQKKCFKITILLFSLVHTYIIQMCRWKKPCLVFNKKLSANSFTIHLCPNTCNCRKLLPMTWQKTVVLMHWNCPSLALSLQYTLISNQLTLLSNQLKLECAASNGNRYPPYPQVMATAISQ